MAAVISASGLYEYSYNWKSFHQCYVAIGHTIVCGWVYPPSRIVATGWKMSLKQLAITRCLPLMTLKQKRLEQKIKDGNQSPHPTYTQYANVSTSHAAGNCVVCKRTCVCLADCPRFAAMDVNERWTTVKDN
uniref:Uncharacterized protein n=1 Tax=Anopheles dirus TaxID=7168 RepID=A0A182NVN7_9DIPT